MNHPFAPLMQYNQWILYDHDKNPLDPRTYRYVDVTSPACWVSYDQAWQAAAGCFGLGFVLTSGDPFYLLDIDKCAVPGGWSALACDLCGRLSGAAIEVSQSGRGLHIIGAMAPGIAHSSRNTEHHIELYTQDRYIALTGRGAVGSAAADSSVALPAIIDQYFKPTDDSGQLEWTDAACREWGGPEDDYSLIQRALATKSAGVFDNRASFAALWYRDEATLSRCYPHPTEPYDRSSADAALALHLAFWTGKNCERMLRIMWQSALVRDKWQREDYLARTILGACGVCREVCQGADTGDIFEGCVYVESMNKIFTPKGTFLSKEQFNAAYGGRIYPISAKKFTAKAWDAFTLCQLKKYPKFDKIDFDPNRPTGDVRKKGKLTYVNTYVPYEARRMPGDPGPFINHLSLLLPDAGDQAILMAYMAACLQHIGSKFQWAPLIQGAEGNGKSLFTRCLAYGIGDQFTYWPKARELASRFNGWMNNKLFIAVEDIYLPKNKFEIIEDLKPLITGDVVDIEQKGADKFNAQNTANWFFNSNHQDAIHKTINDRRFSVFMSAQQSYYEIEATGMGGDYFPRLYNWLKHQDGYAIVYDYLMDYRIPKALNPADGCYRAPKTSTTNEAIEANMSPVAQEIIESIESDRYGFCGDWISSIALTHLLQEIGAQNRVSQYRRKQILAELGYIPHPNLPKGRLTAYIEEGRPVLYVKRDNVILRRIDNSHLIADAYKKAQKRQNLSLIVPKCE